MSDKRLKIKKKSDSPPSWSVNTLEIAQGGSAKFPEALIKDLQALGFGEYEARAYLALSECGPATAYEVAKVAGLPRANVYTVVKTLTEKGAAQPVSDKPVRYMAVEAGELFKGIAESTSKLCEDVIEHLKRSNSQDGRDYVWLFRGQINVTRKISEMIESAEGHVWLKGSDEHLRVFLPYLKKACERGISVVIVLFADSADEFQCGKTCQVYMHEDNGVILGRADQFFTVTADNERAVITRVKGEPEAAYSENRSFVYMVDVMLKHEFYLAEIMQCYGDLIEDRWGPGLNKLRDIYNPAPSRKSFDRYVRRRLGELESTAKGRKKPA